MITEVMAVDPAGPDPLAIITAAGLIAAGRLVAFPTETVYGLGADATNPEAVAKIFEAKGRPATDPLIVHISRLGELDDVADDVPPLATKLAERFWPGPLTLVLRRSSWIPPIVSAGLDTVAVRYPAHPVAVALMRASGRAIAAPSANLFSRPSPTRAEHVRRDLDGRVGLILDGGPTEVGVESTVLDLTVDPPAVLRPGGIAIEDLRDIEPRITYAPRQTAEGEAAPSPGTLLKHYSPQAEVRLFEGVREPVIRRMLADADALRSQGQTVGVLAFSEDAERFQSSGAQLFDLGFSEYPNVVGRNLFHGLRRLDDLNVDVILARAPGRAWLGETVWDRLYRAAEGHVIRVDD